MSFSLDLAADLATQPAVLPSFLSSTLWPLPLALDVRPGPGPALLGLQGLAELPEQPLGLRDLAQALLPEADRYGPGAGRAARLSLSLGAQAGPSWPALGDKESFRLRLRLSERVVQLRAETAAGARHGLHALSQLWHAARSAGATGLPALLIEDAPLYPWRGLLVDVARRPLPMDALLRLLDTMAAARLNVLHWHLCDDQAWRLASERFPRLQACADGGFHYSLAQARHLVSEAAARGIRVLPELDLPGHCWALGLAYPELLCPPAPTRPQRGFGVFPCAVDPLNEALYAFLDGLLGEWATVFPDRYLHLGGDELAPQAWEALAASRGLSLAQLQSHYLGRVGALLQRHGRRLVAWDELGEAQAPLPAGSVLQAWRGEGALRQVVRGAQGRLRSAGYYLDQAHAAAYHWRRRPQAPAQARPPEPGTAWALQAQLGAWQLQGRCWPEGRHGPRLWLRSSGTLIEGLAPQRVRDPACQWRLLCDSDLGELELWGPGLEALGKDEAGAWLRLGNLRLPCVWRALGEQAAEDWPSALLQPGDLPVLGGEAALWSELIEAPQLDLRCGSGLLAVAERLWRDPVVEEASLAALPTRLAAAQSWLQACGRLAAEPAADLFQILAPAEPAALRALALWLEPGAGYARQHAKKLRDAYSLDEPLNRLADALPSESPLMAQLGDSPSAWLAALQQLRQALPGWQSLPVAPRLLARLDGLARLVQALWAEAGPMLKGHAIAAQACLHEGAALVDEMVPALVNPLQRRLDARREPGAGL
ncbi:family 20 glycosylhydrolase [Paucibacter sp. KBW04]|uniref:family 20 glycosylhydrolase n=1 Tax=Paucibacter sp. KBW04 TaxID=2153361 RepID=UPI0018CC474E|nr:family 20 glycosylhydrolase [Paucibacter sp. KBW04]